MHFSKGILTNNFTWKWWLNQWGVCVCVHVSSYMYVLDVSK